MTARRQRVAITGASGLIGGALSSSLRAGGHYVVHLVRREPAAGHERQWDPSGEALRPEVLADVDTVVHLAGAGVGDQRWTPEYKALIHSSRVEGTGLVARSIADGAGPTRLVTASAIGIYGDRGDEVLTESSAEAVTFLANVVRDWEAATTPAKEAGVPVAHARTGIVLSTKGGALTPMLRLGRLGLGGPLGSGRQWMSWITLHDAVAAYTRLIEDSSITGPVNFTAPHPVRQRDLARGLGRVLHRPAVLPAPRAAMRLVLGEFADEVLASSRVLPQRLQDTGFEHAHPRLDDALAHLIIRS
ncbi:TIGR01777 family oxidoreductase [Janibacter limosus]|uniref:TIGR01777 family oxidoreductase n=1 Tax=Janibacter limosus TaxID=53458 RepID=UPI00083626D8|nr:TIGR01777 family oxidoreductase [Janibacter limosus]